MSQCLLVELCSLADVVFIILSTCSLLCKSFKIMRSMCNVPASIEFMYFDFSLKSFLDNGIFVILTNGLLRNNFYK